MSNLIQVIKAPIQTNEQYQIKDFKEYLEYCKSEKIVINKGEEPFIFSLSQIKQLLKDKGYWDKDNYCFKFIINNNTITIER